MTTTLATPPGDTLAPARRTILVLAGILLVGFLVLFFGPGSTDNSVDTPVKDIVASYGYGATTNRVLNVGTMAFCALMITYATAFKAALSGGRRWWVVDVSFVGFGLFAAWMAFAKVASLVTYHAVQTGDTTLIKAANLYDTESFPIAVCALLCLYLGTGAAALRLGTLPRWVAVVSLVLGAILFTGPIAAFVAILAFPLWLIATALTVRTEPTA